jgi:long-chain acyl-CoA synthetase
VNPELHARQNPDKPALIMGTSGEIVTYRELDQRSNRLARLLHDREVSPGTPVAILMENHARYLEVAWAFDRSGMTTTPINSYLTADDVAYILNDAAIRVVVSSAALEDVAREAVSQAPKVEIKLMVEGNTGGADVDGWESYEQAVAQYPPTPLAEQPLGAPMYYSSGTTGRPKGIVRPFPEGLTIHDEHPLAALFGSTFHIDGGTVYLCPAPLFHGAPFAFSLVTQRLGGTVVIMERFDAEQALGLIEKHRVTVGQYVPTMFHRLLALDDDTRSAYDLSSQRWALHAASPCPIAVKQQMIEWWGPIILEYYGGSEMNGLTFIDSHEWLEHPGSVGSPMFGELHIVGDDGKELPPGQVGGIYFGNGGEFHYLNDPDKTAAATLSNGWTTVGDIGYLDDDGRLYLTDRKAHTIISNGVNIYPQEVEDLLAVHPAVADVAVIGVPHPDAGEAVKAVVELNDGAGAGLELELELEAELIEYCRSRLAHYKCPRSVDFDQALPREPTGKLVKRLLKDRYWKSSSRQIG